MAKERVVFSHVAEIVAVRFMIADTQNLSPLELPQQCDITLADRSAQITVAGKLFGLAEQIGGRSRSRDSLAKDDAVLALLIRFPSQPCENAAAESVYEKANDADHKRVDYDLQH